MIKETEEKFKIAEDKRVKIISRAGVKLLNIFEKKNPFAKTEKECNCELIETEKRSETKICKCRVNSVSYQAKCTNCELNGL